MNDDLLQAKINSYATRGFLHNADRDYIHARLAYRSMLSPQFRWSALHCLEKYGKCILLFNRINGKNIRHTAMESIARVKAAGRFEVKLSGKSSDFIARLEKNAANRYLETSWYTLPGDLQRLDQAVIEIRRYCQIFDFEIQTPNGEKVNLFHLYLEQITAKEGRPLENAPLTDGFLEKVIAEPNHPARDGLLWDNRFFGTPAENEQAPWEYSASENSPLDLHADVIGELAKLVHLPKFVKSSIKSIPRDKPSVR
jgi:hypothetical protein